MLIDSRPQEYISEGFTDTELIIMDFESYLSAQVGKPFGEDYAPFPINLVIATRLPRPTGFPFPEICL